MNSLQIEYLNSLNRSKEIDQNIAESKSRQTSIDQQNLITRANLSNLGRKILNDQYKLDMDNAMLYNTVDWWVNDGKKLSDTSNRAFNPYWNTQGNMWRNFQETMAGIGSILSLGATASGSAASTVTNTNTVLNGVRAMNSKNGGFIN